MASLPWKQFSPPLLSSSVLIRSNENQILISESEQNQMVVDFIRAFSDRLPICIQREIKLPEEIQINLLRTFQ